MAWARATLLYSPNQGTNWSVINEAISGQAALPTVAVPYRDNADDQRLYVADWGVIGIERKSLDGGTTLNAINPPTNVRFKAMIGEHTWNENLVFAVGEIGAQDSYGELTISLDGATSWGAGIDIGMIVWCISGFPYNQQLMYFGRAKMYLGDQIGNYPDMAYGEPPAVPVLKITQDQGATLLDKSGNLRTGYNVQTITDIIPDWLSD